MANTKQSVKLDITNHAAMLGGDIPVDRYDIYVKQSNTAADLPDESDEYFYGTCDGHMDIKPHQLFSTAKFINVRAVPFSETGEKGTAWTGSISAGLFKAIDEYVVDDGNVLVHTPYQLIKMVDALASGNVSALDGTLKAMAVEMAKWVCCDCNNVCSGTSTTEDEIESQDNYINYFYKGTPMSGKELFNTELGGRYAIQIKGLRLSNAVVGAGVNILQLSADNVSQYKLPSGETEFDDTTFGPVLKSAISSLEIKAIANGLHDPRIRWTFRITGYGTFDEAGESTYESFETIFQHMAALIAGQEIEPEGGVDYGSRFEVLDFEPIVQVPPSGGDLTLRVGDELGGAGNYVDLVIADGDQSVTDFASTLIVTDPKALYCKVIGDPHNAGYLQLNCRIRTQSISSGAYPYNYPPEWITYFFQGSDLGGVERHMRTFKDAMASVWVEVSLQQDTVADVTFRISGSVTTSFIDVKISAGTDRNDVSGTIELSAGESYQVEVIDGTAEYYTVLSEVHRRTI